MPDHIHPGLRGWARCVPAADGWLTRRLHLARRVAAVAERVLRLPGVHEVGITATARVRLHRPPDRPTAARGPAVLWIHGGGYVTGSPRFEDRSLRRLARTLGALVVAVEYRLAPEHAYPAASDDCYAALCWLAERDDVDTERIVVAGTSAGGGLAAGLVLRSADAGLLRLAGQVLTYPMLDDRTALRPATRRIGWTHADNAFGWRSYLGAEPGAADVSAYASPARRRELSGLPPTWIGVGTSDLLHDEGVDYAHRLALAGVDVDLEVVRGGFHGFDVAPRNAVARDFTGARLRAIRRMLASR